MGDPSWQARQLTNHQPFEHTDKSELFLHSTHDCILGSCCLSCPKDLHDSKSNQPQVIQCSSLLTLERKYCSVSTSAVDLVCVVRIFYPGLTKNVYAYSTCILRRVLPFAQNHALSCFLRQSYQYVFSHLLAMEYSSEFCPYSLRCAFKKRQTLLKTWIFLTVCDSNPCYFIWSIQWFLLNKCEYWGF